MNVKFEMILSRTRESAEQLGQTMLSLSSSPLGEINNRSVNTVRMTLGNSAGMELAAELVHEESCLSGFGLPSGFDSNQPVVEARDMILTLCL